MPGGFIAGVAPGGAARVTVSYSGREADAALGPPGHLPLGARFFAAALVEGPQLDETPVVVALDASGHEVSRWPAP